MTTTTIIATFTSDDEKTVRTLTLPHDVSDRVAQLIARGLLTEIDADICYTEDDILFEVHRGGDLNIDWDLNVDESNIQSSPNDANDANEDAPTHSYRAGDIVEVTTDKRGAYGPPLGARVKALEVDNTHYPVRVDWPDAESSALTRWMMLDEIKPAEPQIGDTVRVIARDEDDPPIDHRGKVLDIIEPDGEVRMTWSGSSSEDCGWWMRRKEVRVVDGLPAHTYHVGDLVRVAKAVGTGYDLPVGTVAHIVAIDNTSIPIKVVDPTSPRGVWMMLDEIEPMAKVTDTTDSPDTLCDANDYRIDDLVELGAR